jgi:hypothetical protein
MKFNHLKQVKHFEWSLLHQPMQSSLDDIMYDDVCMLTVGAGGSFSEQETDVSFWEYVNWLSSAISSTFLM